MEYWVQLAEATPYFTTDGSWFDAGSFSAVIGETGAATGSGYNATTGVRVQTGALNTSGPLAGWHHVAVVASPTMLTVAVDGVEGTPVARAGTPQTWSGGFRLETSSCTTTVGSDAFSEVAVYPYALSATAIANHACAGLGSGSNACGRASSSVAQGLGNHTASGGGLVGEPVNAVNGNLVENLTDLSAPPGVFGMDFTRTYNSEDGSDGLLGVGWTSPLDVSLAAFGSTADGDASYVLRMPDGSRYPIVQDGSGWSVPAALYATFTTAGGPKLSFGTGETWTFDSSGRLVSRTDGLGQSIVVAWAPSAGVLATVTSSNSGQAGWSYQLLGSAGRASGVVGPFPAGGSTTGAPRVDYHDATDDDGVHLDKVSRPYASGAAPVAWEHYGFDANGYVSTISDDYLGATQLTTVSSVFDVDGRVTSQTLLGGQTVTLAYAAGVTTVTNQGGASGPTDTLAYHYDSAGNITQVTDPWGNVSSQTMANDRPTGATRRPADGSSPAAVSGYTVDPTRGTTAAIARPNPSTGAAVADSGGKVSSYCSGDDRPTALTNSAGIAATLSYGSSGCAAGTGLPTTLTVGGATTTNAPVSVSGSATDLLASSTDADGDATYETWQVGRRQLLSSSDNPASGVFRTTFYGYDSAGRQTVVRTPAGVETWTSYNPDGTVASVVGPVTVANTTRGCPTVTTAAGALAASCTFPGSPPTGPTTASGYYLDGTLKQAVANGQTTTHAVTYPGGGGVVSTVTPPTHDEADGSHVAQVTVTTTDAMGRVVSTKVGDPAKPAEVATTTNTYEDPHNPTAGHLGRVSSTTSPTGVHTYYAYDNDGRVFLTQVGGTPPDRLLTGGLTMGSNGCWSVAAPYGDPGHTTSTTYDRRGRVTDVCGPAGDTSPTGAAVRSHTHTDYDSADRAVATTQGDSSGPQVKTRLAYDAVTGLLMQKVVDLDASGGTIDANDQVTQYFYSKAGRLLVSFTDPVDAATFTWPTAAPLATYDASGNPVINAQGTRVTQYKRDGAGQVTSTIDALGRTTADTYDADGNVAKHTLPGGYYHQYAYDAFGNVITDTTPTPAGGTGTVSRSWAYDNDDRLVATTTPPAPGNIVAATVARAYYPDGSLKWVTNALGGTASATNPNTTTYAYDSRGNRTQRTTLVNPNPAAPTTYNTVTQKWTYNLADHVTTARPDGTAGHAVAYTYDDDTNPNSASYPHGTTTAGQGTGRLRVVVQASGRSTTYGYGANGLATMVWNDQPSTTETTAQTWYDQLGRRTKVHDTLNGTSGEDSTYSYDALGDLTASSLPPSPSNPTPHYSYTYDLNGLPQSLSYPDGSQHTFFHDKLGRLTQSNVIWPGLGQADRGLRVRHQRQPHLGGRRLQPRGHYLDLPVQRRPLPLQLHPDHQHRPHHQHQHHLGRRWPRSIRDHRQHRADLRVRRRRPAHLADRWNLGTGLLVRLTR
ncbi:DUF6531 domain-containing protein [Aquihabitans sp. McL0605]|uniref:DUF6531 domain-containing protein n=1 Tax=Aquihabitans sp. McL0605 TaxID=3415671 RepID=UPI003CF83577